MPRTGRTNVKTGCRTCKIRKVKCDEGYPACHRCVSSGRICDGYGIWGGGGSFCSSQLDYARSKACRIILTPPVSISTLGCGLDELYSFEWFKLRTVTKLPGTFVSNFWNTLLLQASMNQPAVTHAVLALSSVHRSGLQKIEGHTRNTVVPEKHEHITLQHYVKAIGHLSHVSTKDKASIRITLIICIVFVSLEFLRGHFETAQIHLRNGLRVLGESQMRYDGRDGVLCLNAFHDSTDDWIVEAFSRLHLQVELFQHFHRHSCLVLEVIAPDIPTLMFHSTNQAWQQLVRLLNRIFLITHQARQHAESSRDCDSFPYRSELSEKQCDIKVALIDWLTIFKTFNEILEGQGPAQDERIPQLLRIYHTMATIMAETCLHPNDESIFDSHTDLFALLISHLVTIWTMSRSVTPFQVLPGLLMDMSHSVVDMGWIPPLYYVALKCRVHRMRLQAIRLLETISHREGIWDTKISACIMKKVMEIEEGGFYNDLDTADDFLLTSSPGPKDLSLATLPDSRRLREVEVVLSGAPTDKILLFCKQHREGTICRVLISEYEVNLQRWTDQWSAYVNGY